MTKIVFEKSAETSLVEFLASVQNTLMEQDPEIATSSLVIEVRTKSGRSQGSIKPLVEGMIADGKSNRAILEAVVEAFPEAKTSQACVAWYRSQMNKRVYKPLVAELRAKNLTAELDDKEIVAKLQAAGVTTLEDAEKIAFKE